MTLFLNILWMILGGGIWVAFLYLLGGALLCATIIGIPFGVQCMKLAGLALMPFGTRMIEEEKDSGCVSLGCNILWILVGGIWIAASHLALGIGLAVTIIGIPFAIQHFKLTSLALLPFGRRVVRD